MLPADTFAASPLLRGRRPTPWPPGTTRRPRQSTRTSATCGTSRSRRCSAMTCPADCPKFDTCGAPVCPLDPLWPSAVHLGGEPVCRYLLASGKAGVEEKYGTDPVYRRVLVELPLVLERHPMIAYEVARSARSGFRGRTAAHMRHINPRKAARKAAPAVGDLVKQAGGDPGAISAD